MATLAIVLNDKITPIDPTIPGSAITYAGYPGETFSIQLIAYNDQGTSIIPLPDDIIWDVQNTTVAKLTAFKGLNNTVVLGPSRGETTATVVWRTQNIKGIIKIVTVSSTSQTTVTYDDGTVVGQLIKIVSAPTVPAPGDPAGATKIYVAEDGVIPDIAAINTTTSQSKLTPRGNIIRMTDALSITGDGLTPTIINSNVGDPIDIRKTLTFRNKTLNVPIQVTLKVADYFGIYTEFGELKNFNFIVQPQEIQNVDYGINKDTIKTMIPNTYTNPVKISAVSMDSGQIFLE
jgi:hypothetical protein